MKQLDLIEERRLGDTRLIVLKNLQRHSQDDSQSLQGIKNALEKEREIRSKFIDFLQRFGVGRGFQNLRSKYPYFDAYGRAVSRKRIFVVVEVNNHRPISRHDIDGLRDRVFFLRRRLRARSVVLYLLGRFDEEAWKVANNMGWRAFSISRFEELSSMILIRGRGIIWFRKGTPPKRVITMLDDWEELKHLGAFKAQLFEADVRNVFDLLDYRTRNRYNIYVDRYGALTIDCARAQTCKRLR